MAPRTFSELLSDSLLLLKESAPEWLAIVAAGLLPGLAVTTTVLLALGLTELPALKDAIAQGEPGVVLPLLAAGLVDRACGALSMLALLRAAAARDMGLDVGVRKAYADALPRLIPFALAQLRALLSIAWGLLRLLWPGLKLCVLYSFVPVACVVEDQSGERALSRSAAVAGADPAKTFGNLAGASALACLCYGALAFVLTAAMTFPRTAMPGGESLPEAMLLRFMDRLLSGLVFGWLAGFSILLYRDLAPAAAR
ncbi:MAG: hypothetical protein HY077_11215 [Elusimicrobia bacterium]|nr:hypothetical protein [Elusimicrobiota bacterium]